MKKRIIYFLIGLLLSFLTIPFYAHATYAPSMPIRIFPTSAYRGNIQLTTAGNNKAVAVAQQQAQAAAVNMKSNSAFLNYFIPVRLFYNGLEAQVYFKILSYYGPYGADTWAQTFNTCYGTSGMLGCEERYGEFTGIWDAVTSFSMNGLVKTGTCYTSIMRSGFSGNVPPAHSFVTGKGHRTFNFDYYGYQYGPNYCTPYNSTQHTEYWTTYMNTASVSLGPMQTDLPLGSLVITQGVDVPDLRGAFKYPSPTNSTTYPPATPYDTSAEGQDLESYLANGGLPLVATDITTFTVVGPSGFESANGGQTTSVSVSSTVVNVTVNMSTAEIVNSVNGVNDTLSDDSGPSVTPTDYANELIAVSTLPPSFTLLQQKLSSITSHAGSYDWNQCIDIPYFAGTIPFCWTSIPHWLDIVALLRFFVILGAFLIAYQAILQK